MRSTFFDAQLQEHLERDGFVVTPMLSADEVAELRARFDELGPAPGDGQKACHSSFHSFDRDYKVSVDGVVRSVLDPHLAAIFDRQRALPCNYLVKWPGAMGGFGLHQDIAVCDETQFRSVEVWVALEDIDEVNGQLWMVPGSANWLPGFTRGIAANEFPFREVSSRIIERHSRPVPVKAGEAVVFQHSTLHFSLPNKSTRPRLVAITDLIPEEADHTGYFGDGEDGIAAYLLTEDFWVDNSPFNLRRPDVAHRVSRGPKDARRLTDSDLDLLVADGLAIDSEAHPVGAINAARAWCHRCGATGFDSHVLDRQVGNVTLLCPDCARIEPMRYEAGLQDRVDLAERELDETGFSVVALLDRPDRESLLAQFSEIESRLPDGFATSANDLPRDLAQQVDVAIRSFLAPRLERVFGPKRLTFGSFLYKAAGSGAAVSFHQDLTYVDEREHRAHVVWIPLTDSGEGSDSLLVVPGSHRWSDSIRPSRRSALPTEQIADELASVAVAIDVPAGSAAVWDSALVHATSPYHGARSRPVVGVVMVPEDAELVHFQQFEPGDELVGYRVSDAFFTEQSIFDRPEGCAPLSPWTDSTTTSSLQAALNDQRVTSDCSAAIGVNATSSHDLDPAAGITSAFPTSVGRTGSVLVDPGADRDLANNGFAPVPLLSIGEARELRDLYFELRGEGGAGFESDLQIDDQEYRRRAARALSDALDDRLTALFDGYEPFLYSFLCKYPGVESELYLHRDWMYVDERDGERTFAVWIAAEDITAHNGQLQVLRNSHTIDSMLRGTNLIAPWLQHETTIRNRLATVPVHAGDAVVFDNALAHCSYPNLTETPRVAIAVAMRPRGVPLVHFRRTGPTTATKYAVDREFFLDTTAVGLMRSMPAHYEPIEEVTVAAAALSALELESALNSSNAARMDAVHNAVHRVRGRAVSSTRRAAAQSQQRARSARARVSTTAAHAVARAGALDVPSRVRTLRIAAATKAKEANRKGRSLLADAPTKAAIGILGVNEAAITRFGPATPAVWDPAVFPWTLEVEAAWPVIRAEVERLLEGDREIPDIEAVTGGIPQGNVGVWKSFVLMHHGNWMTWNCERCPDTTAVVRSIPGLTMAGFSVLHPGTHITEHRGPNKGALRYQLGVRVPGQDGDCRIRVGDEMIHWRDGESVVFDFTVPHEAWNDTDEIRVLLMLEFRTPLPAFLGLPNRFAQHAMGWFPTTRAMHRRLLALEPELKK